MTRSTSRRRRGATVIEFAFAGPIALFLMLFIFSGGVGVASYHETARLAREGARFASVRGARYMKEENKPAATSEDVQQYVRGRAVIIDPAAVHCNVAWHSSNAPYNVQYDKASGVTTVTNNTVTLTTTYDWSPAGFPFGPIRLQSTSTMPLSH